MTQTRKKMRLREPKRLSPKNMNLRHRLQTKNNEPTTQTPNKKINLRHRLQTKKLTYDTDSKQKNEPTTQTPNKKMNLRHRLQKKKEPTTQTQKKRTYATDDKENTLCPRRKKK